MKDYEIRFNRFSFYVYSKRLNIQYGPYATYGEAEAKMNLLNSRED